MRGNPKHSGAIPMGAPSRCDGSPSAGDLRHRAKLRELIERHEACKASFQNLRSQIHIGLAEAKEVFDSLSAPLLTLVGIKSDQMAEDGRSSSILLNPEFDPSRGNRFGIGGREAEGLRCWRSAEERKRILHYSTSAKNELQKLHETQLRSVHRLIILLHTIKHNVNNHQDTIFQSLDSHRNSIHTFFKRSASIVSELPQSRQQQDTATVTAYVAGRALTAAYDHVGSVLDRVEHEVERLLKDLAEVICAPMAAHLKSLRAQVTGGSPARLVSIVEEIEKALQETWEVDLELERALQERGNTVKELERALGAAMVEVQVTRKKARIEEQEKLEASRLHQEYQEKFRQLKQLLLEGAFSEKQPQQATRGPFQLTALPNNGQPPIEEPTISRVVKHQGPSHLQVARRPITRSCTGSSCGQKTPPVSAPSSCPRSAPLPSMYRKSTLRCRNNVS